jgi:hypothetical protein
MELRRTLEDAKGMTGNTAGVSEPKKFNTKDEG